MRYVEVTNTAVTPNYCYKTNISSTPRLTQPYIPPR